MFRLTGTSYRVVDPDLIGTLHQKHYAELVSGEQRLRLFTVCRVVDPITIWPAATARCTALVDGRTRDLVILMTSPARGPQSLPV